MTAPNKHSDAAHATVILEQRGRRECCDCGDLLLVCAAFRGIRCREIEHPPAGLFCE